jgi:hypothetical protein
MNAPPNTMIIKMTDADVQENLIHIVNSLDRIRRESIANIEATDDQKQDYLRLTGELASCVKASIDGNSVLGEHYNQIKSMIKEDKILQSYDPSQEEFWNNRNTELKSALSNASIVFFRDDFKNVDQGYHLLQAFKYLSVNGDRDSVYKTILPINSLLNDHSVYSPEVSKFLLKKMFTQNGLGVEAHIDSEQMMNALANAGALYVDLPKDQYQSMKKKFPKTTMIEEGKEKFTRVIFTPKELASFNNATEQLKEYALMDFGEVEDTLVKKMSEFHSYGKKFLGTVTKTIGLTETADKKQIKLSKKTLDNKLFELDSNPEKNGEYLTQDDWIKYWNNQEGDRYNASAPDLYDNFKRLKVATESGTDEEKNSSKTLVDSLRKDFNDRWLVTSTRLQYNINPTNNLEGKVIHHYKCKNPDLTKETTLNIQVYRGDKIADVINTEDGLKYLQTYWGTEDDAETIMQTMEFISKKKRNAIKVWTADSSDRSNVPERAAFLSYFNVVFRIGGNGNLNYDGRSRGGAYK